MAVEQFEIVRKGHTYVVLKDDRGEIFHFKKAVLKRGLPAPPYKLLEECTRPIYLLTLENCSNRVGISVGTLREWIAKGKLKAVMKIFYYGVIKRHGWLVDERDLKDAIAARTRSKWAGKLSEQAVMELERESKSA